MHTFERGKYVFNYNSDLSGNVIISRIKNVPLQDPNLNIRDLTETFNIEGHILLEFIANFVRDQKIAALESADTEEILGFSMKFPDWKP